MHKPMLIFVSIVIVTITVAVIFLKPIIFHENEYKVVVVNMSEYPISHMTVSGAGEDSSRIGPINPGKYRHYIFTPKQNGKLEYLVVQNKRNLRGVINDNLQIGDVGEIFVIVKEMYKINVRSEFDL